MNREDNQGNGQKLLKLKRTYLSTRKTHSSCMPFRHVALMTRYAAT